MGNMGFPRRWKHWIIECSEFASAFVLVNKSLIEEFAMKMGLRLCDPL